MRGEREERRFGEVASGTTAMMSLCVSARAGDIPRVCSPTAVAEYEVAGVKNAGVELAVFQVPLRPELLGVGVVSSVAGVCPTANRSRSSRGADACTECAYHALGITIVPFGM